MSVRESVRHRVALAGHVVLGDGSAAEGAVVTIASGPPAFARRAATLAELASGHGARRPERIDRVRTRADGLFHFMDLPGGTYRLEVHMPAPGARFGTATADVLVPDDPSAPFGTTTIELPATTIAGRVVDATGLYGALVRATPGLVGRWRLSEADGIAHDDVGGRHAVPNGALDRAVAGLVALESDGAVSCSGTGFFEVPWHAALNPPAFSVEARATVAGGDAWRQTGGGSWRCAVGSCDAASSAPFRGFELGVGPPGRWELRVGDSAAWRVIPGPAVSDDAVHVVGTYDGAVARLYVDGIAGSPTPGFTAWQNSSRPLRIGASAIEPAPWNGVLDEVAIYDRALTPAEVHAHHAAGAGHPASGVRMASVRVEGADDQTFSGSDGSFHMARVEPGARRVTVASSGHVPASHAATVAAGQTATVTVVLERSETT